ncbi:type II toxin-antitoxin system VapC family toxin [Streptomyces sp. SID13031]|uniref:PIN domain-containing protein n=1 Tax=Streptomyces sp. SID13031 TaxID=2706046 RepID=UPI0013C8BADC|nr:type II toxin-antitoxin system VapC family toxin [Streptomyces sp. SID13031]
MIIYVDSSVLVRAYLPDEHGHTAANDLLIGEDALVTSTWTLVEVTSALTRAARGGRANLDDLLAAFEADTAVDGPVTLLRPDAVAIEARAIEIVRDHAIRSLDALHLAVAELAALPLSSPEACGFASRDSAQAEVAAKLGFIVL